MAHPTPAERKTAPAAGAAPKEPLVTVVVPVFNAEPYLDQCLSSIRSQTHENLQILCFNDGSTDASLDTLQRHAREDERIVVINKRNEGYGATCNRGIDEAQGSWLAVVEPDDWIEPGMFHDMLRFAASLGSACDIVKTPYWRIVAPDTAGERRLNCSFRGRIKPKNALFSVEEAPHLLRHHPSIWSALYRTDFIREKRIRFHEIPGAGWADNPFLVDTLCATDRIAYLDVPYYCYREQTDEQAGAALRKNPLLPLERWNDMMDSLERMGIASATVIEEVYRRAFTYFQRITEQTGDAKDVIDAAKRSFARMNADRVLSSRIISPADKQRYADLMNLPYRSDGKLRWLATMAGEFFYALRNNGVGYTVEMVVKALRG